MTGPEGVCAFLGGGGGVGGCDAEVEGKNAHWL